MSKLSMFNSIMFSASVFGFYGAWIIIPGLVESGAAPEWIGHLKHPICGLSIGWLGGVLAGFFVHVSDIAFAMKNR